MVVFLLFRLGFALDLASNPTWTIRVLVHHAPILGWITCDSSVPSSSTSASIPFVTFDASAMAFDAVVTRVGPPKTRLCRTDGHWDSLGLGPCPTQKDRKDRRSTIEDGRSHPLLGATVRHGLEKRVGVERWNQDTMGALSWRKKHKGGGFDPHNTKEIHPSQVHRGKKDTRTRWRTEATKQPKRNTHATKETNR